MLGLSQTASRKPLVDKGGQSKVSPTFSEPYSAVAIGIQLIVAATRCIWNCMMWLHVSTRDSGWSRLQ